jgi:hydrogenase expression/formation protein HypC
MCLGVPGKVLDTYRQHDVLMGRVDFGGAVKRVCLECVSDTQPGEYVLVHVGFALARMDEAEAQRVWQLLQELGEAVEDADIDDADIDEADVDGADAHEVRAEVERSTSSGGRHEAPR